MKNLLNLALTAATAAMLAIAGCSSTKDDPTPAANTGTISGTVSPAGSITSVTATSASGQTTTASPNASTGAYSFASLAVGTYSLTFAPATGYTAPAARPGLTVTAGQTTAAGTTTVSATGGGAAGSFTWTEGGAMRSGLVQTHTLQTSSTAGKYILTLNAATASGGSITNNDLITISLLNVSAPGTYALGINIASGVLASATITRNRVGSPAAIWGYGPGLGGGQGSGSVTLTSFDPTARTAAGTFTFVGGPVTNTGTVNTVAVTNGAFNVTIP